MKLSRLPLCLAALALATPLHAAPPAPGAVPVVGAGDGSAAEVRVSTPADPLPLPLGGSVTSRLPEGTSAVYLFEATEPGVLKVAVGGESDLVLCVVTPEGLEAAAGLADDNEEGDWSERVEVPLFNPGTYTVVVGAGVDEDAPSFFLAATFAAGEPQPSDTLEESDIELMRSLAKPQLLVPDRDATAPVAAEQTVAFRVKAEPGVYVVTSASDEDIELKATSAGWTDEALSPWSFPSFDAWGPLLSDEDLGGDLGREAVVLLVEDGAEAWIAVSNLGQESVFTLRLQRASFPEAPALGS